MYDLIKKPVSHQPQVKHEFHQHMHQAQPIPQQAPQPLKSAMKKSPMIQPVEPVTSPPTAVAPAAYQKGNEFFISFFNDNLGCAAGQA